MAGAQHGRQVLLWGRDNQERLEKGSVCVLGSGVLSQYISASLAALGIGRIVLMSNDKIRMGSRDDFLIEKNRIGEPKVMSLAKRLRMINPSGEIVPFAAPFCGELLNSFPVDILISTDNRKAAHTYARRRRKEFVDASGAEIRRYPCIDRSGWQKLAKNHAAPTGCALAAGVVCDMVRKEYVRLDADRQVSSFSRAVDTWSGGSRGPEGLSFLVVGAGALGNFAALGLAQSGAGRVDVADFDTVEISNLNRQILLYDSIGQSKAEVLSRRIRGIARSQAFVRRITARSRVGKYDAVLGCVDSIRARIGLSDLCARLKVPYVDGGTSSLNGEMYTYIPGMTPCIKCQKNLEALLPAEAEVRGCAQAAPSVVAPNMVIGSLMAERALDVLLRPDDLVVPLRYSGCDSSLYKVAMPAAKKGCRC